MRKNGNFQWKYSLKVIKSSIKALKFISHIHFFFVFKPRLVLCVNDVKVFSCFFVVAQQPWADNCAFLTNNDDALSKTTKSLSFIVLLINKFEISPNVALQLLTISDGETVRRSTIEMVQKSFDTWGSFEETCKNLIESWKVVTRQKGCPTLLMQFQVENWKLIENLFAIYSSLFKF